MLRRCSTLFTHWLASKVLDASVEITSNMDSLRQTRRPGKFGCFETSGLKHDRYRSCFQKSGHGKVKLEWACQSQNRKATKSMFFWERITKAKLPEVRKVHFFGVNIQLSQLYASKGRKQCFRKFQEKLMKWICRNISYEAARNWVSKTYWEISVRYPAWIRPTSSQLINFESFSLLLKCKPSFQLSLCSA